MSDPRQRADELNERGRSLSDEGRTNEATDAYRSAIEADPTWSVPWYNLGLGHKYACEWTESLECNRRAVALDDSDAAAWWNLGIAATALGRWPEAREAWLRCGVAIPEGDGPVRAAFGPTPVRLDPQGRGEVVWCDRIGPARAIIRNVPFPESGHCWGDLLLHDGAPNGYRILNGQEVPVFDALQRIGASEHRTYILDLPGSTPEQRALIGDVASRLGGAAEDWSQSVAFLCRQCSEGRPHEQHDRALSGDRPELAVAAAAASDEQLSEIIEAWRGEAGYDGHVGSTAATQMDDEAE